MAPAKADSLEYRTVIKMEKKILSITLAAMFVVAAFGGFLFAADESDATGSTTSGTYSVYVNDGSGWQSSVVDTGVYDAAQAVKQSGFWVSGDSMVEKYTTGQWVTYNSTTYGDITTFMGKTNGDNSMYWSLFVGDDDLLISEATVSLGNYTCFDDYQYAYANIILYYGLSMITEEDVQDSLDDYYLDEDFTGAEPSYLTPVSSSDDGFKFTFALNIALQVNPVNNQSINSTVSGTYYGVTTYGGSTPIQVTDSNMKSGTIYVTGYGSNAYLAFKQVITNANDVVASTAIGSYSWITTIFGLGTIQTAGLSTPYDWSDDNYAYWVIYDDYTGFGDNASAVSDFVLGAYAPLACAPIYDTTIALIYGTYAMVA